MVQLAPTARSSSNALGHDSYESDTWIALRTKSRQEKAVARCAESREISYYLPLIDRVSIIRHRRCTSRVPVFPGYVFLQGDLDDAYDRALAPRICQIIPIRDQSRFVWEIEQVKRALEGSVPLELYPFAVSGRRCRVARGPLHGVEGVLLDRKNATRMVLQVDIIGQGVALEIDIDMLEAMD